MSNLDQDPQVAQLAKELGLEGQGEWLAKIQGYAVSKVEEFLNKSGLTVESLDGLLRLLAERLSVKIEYVRRDQDLHRIAGENQFTEAPQRKLFRDLNDAETDGLLIRNPDTRRGSRAYLAIVDARDGHAARAYFTAWHELAHLLVTPPQRAFQGVYRTVSVSRNKDPEESVVDAVASELAFYDPLVNPALEKEEANEGGMTFSVVDRVRESVAPDASFFATAIACVRRSDQPALLVRVEEAYKKSERKRLESAQEELDLGDAAPRPEPQVRAVQVIRSSSASNAGLEIFPNMQVPERSVLYRAYQAEENTELQAIEDQQWWLAGGETRPPLPLRVEARRLGDFVYGLLTPA